ncbi:hypothetical protein GOODEAATRI_024608, partial [Goodea atripinnis]
MRDEFSFEDRKEKVMTHNFLIFDVSPSYTFTVDAVIEVIGASRCLIGFNVYTLAGQN